MIGAQKSEFARVTIIIFGRDKVYNIITIVSYRQGHQAI